jgi:hypothetical protein
MAACGDARGAPEVEEASFVLGSVVIDADGNRTTYVQALATLDGGHIDNTNALELPGNGTVIASTKSFFVGLPEEPTWVRYGLNEAGAIEETGRMSLLNTGATAIDYGNAIVDEDTAVSVLSAQAIAIVWNPSTMEIKGEIDLGHLVREGFELEVWTTVARNGLVYIPGRWADWDGSRIFPAVSITIVDPKTMSVVGIAEDDRCASGGNVAFDADGFAYVMGDGRNASLQMFARAAGAPEPQNCILRIAPGAVDFERDFFFTVPSLTGGLESMTELESPAQGTGVAFSKMFYPAELPADVSSTDFDFWGARAHKLWRIELANPPRAEEVVGAPFSAIGFTGAAVDGLYFSGESVDAGATSDVISIDPATNVATKRFSMIGYFNGLFRLVR